MAIEKQSIFLIRVVINRKELCTPVTQWYLDNSRYNSNNRQVSVCKSVRLSSSTARTRSNLGISKMEQDFLMPNSNLFGSNK